MRGQRGLHVVRVVLYVVVFQYRLDTAVLFLLTLLGTCHFGRQELFREQRLLRWGQLAGFYDFLDRFLNGAALLVLVSSLSLSLFELVLFLIGVGISSLHEAAEVGST